jgi:hypothetical protein
MWQRVWCARSRGTSMRSGRVRREMRRRIFSLQRRVRGPDERPGELRGLRHSVWRGPGMCARSLRRRLSRGASGMRRLVRRFDVERPALWRMFHGLQRALRRHAGLRERHLRFHLRPRSLGVRRKLRRPELGCEPLWCLRKDVRRARVRDGPLQRRHLRLRVCRGCVPLRGHLHGHLCRPGELREMRCPLRRGRGLRERRLRRGLSVGAGPVRRRLRRHGLEHRSLRRMQHGLSGSGRRNRRVRLRKMCDSLQRGLHGVRRGVHSHRRRRPELRRLSEGVPRSSEYRGHVYRRNVRNQVRRRVQRLRGKLRRSIVQRRPLRDLSDCVLGVARLLGWQMRDRLRDGSDRVRRFVRGARDVPDELRPVREGLHGAARRRGHLRRGHLWLQLHGTPRPLRQPVRRSRIVSRHLRHLHDPVPDSRERRRRLLEQGMRRAVQRWLRDLFRRLRRHRDGQEQLRRLRTPLQRQPRLRRGRVRALGRRFDGSSITFAPALVAQDLVRLFDHGDDLDDDVGEVRSARREDVARLELAT